jgi:hypothetical protein
VLSEEALTELTELSVRSVVERPEHLLALLDRECVVVCDGVEGAFDADGRAFVAVLTQLCGESEDGSVGQFDPGDFSRRDTAGCVAAESVHHPCFGAQGFTGTSGMTHGEPTRRRTASECVERSRAGRSGSGCRANPSPVRLRGARRYDAMSRT